MTEEQEREIFVGVALRTWRYHGFDGWVTPDDLAVLRAEIRKGWLINKATAVTAVAHAIRRVMREIQDIGR